MSQTLDAVLQKDQTMPEKNRLPAVLQPVCTTGDKTHCLTKSHHGSEDGTGRGTPIVIDRAAFNQGENAQYDPHIGEADVMDTVVARGPHAVGIEMAVRRLTPNECLRLQGFPDNWTNIPWKGNPTAPDGPQYKCAGNSFAVPVVRWIGTRIASQQ